MCGIRLRSRLSFEFANGCEQDIKRQNRARARTARIDTWHDAETNGTIVIQSLFARRCGKMLLFLVGY